MDGLTATRLLSASTDGVRVLVLTTFDLDEYVFEALRCGACGFLLKDARPAELVDAIAEETASDRNEVVKLYRRSIAKARRIDFLFSTSFMPTACLTQQLIGQPIPMGSAFGSDHYGLLNTYSYQRTAC